MLWNTFINSCLNSCSQSGTPCNSPLCFSSLSFSFGFSCHEFPRVSTSSLLEFSVSVFCYTSVELSWWKKGKVSQHGASITAATTRLKSTVIGGATTNFLVGRLKKTTIKRKDASDERSASAIGIRFTHSSCTLRSRGKCPCTMIASSFCSLFPSQTGPKTTSHSTSCRERACDADARDFLSVFSSESEKTVDGPNVSFPIHRLDVSIDRHVATKALVLRYVWYVRHFALQRLISRPGFSTLSPSLSLGHRLLVAATSHQDLASLKRNLFPQLLPSLYMEFSFSTREADNRLCRWRRFHDMFPVEDLAWTRVLLALQTSGKVRVTVARDLLGNNFLSFETLDASWIFQQETNAFFKCFDIGRRRFRHRSRHCVTRKLQSIQSTNNHATRSNLVVKVWLCMNCLSYVLKECLLHFCVAKKNFGPQFLSVLDQLRFQYVRALFISRDRRPKYWTFSMQHMSKNRPKPTWCGQRETCDTSRSRQKSNRKEECERGGKCAQSWQVNPQNRSIYQ